MISVLEGRLCRPWGFGGAALNKRKSPLGRALGEALAKPEAGHFRDRTEGRGGKALTFLGVCIYTPYLARPKKTQK